MVEDQHFHFRLRGRVLRPVRHGLGQFGERGEQSLARLLYFLPVRFADVRLEQQIEQGQFLVAQALFGGAALFGVEALGQLDQLGEGLLDGGGSFSRL